MTPETNQDETPPTGDGAAGAAVYTKFVLSIYDPLVIRFENAWVWKCPSPLMLDHYNRHVSGNHLEVGVGTGYLLDNCQFPVDDPTIALMDLNPNPLKVTAARIRRHRPATYLANVWEPIKIDMPSLDSIGLNYLLHCLPGNMRAKGIVFRNLKPLLNSSGGVLFGTTILGQDTKPNLLAKTLLRAYNAKGIFSNTHDNLDDLVSGLQDNFREYSVEVVGCVAFFTGRT